MSVTLSDIKTAAGRISCHVHKTQILTSSTFDKLAAGKKLFFKCENFQKTGSFKARGKNQYILKIKPKCLKLHTFHWSAISQSECRKVGRTDGQQLKIHLLKNSTKMLELLGISFEKQNYPLKLISSSPID